MSKGGYLGGSTLIGPRSRGWFSNQNTAILGKKSPKPKKNSKATKAAIVRHQQQLEIERYRLLAEALRKEGFSEREVRRGLKLQQVKDAQKDRTPVTVLRDRPPAKRKLP